MLLDSLYRPFIAHFRGSRIKALYEFHGITSRTEVLDIGGSPYIWELAQSIGYPLPRITMVNLGASKVADCIFTNYTFLTERHWR